ncbi:MAG: methyltransferase [Candidatus Coatesbacteria bacterium]|nr:methyltransferase [Candidatus Coatesbacteria bacterium]
MAQSSVSKGETAERFDVDNYTHRTVWPPIFRFFDRSFPKGAFHLLDVGGGAGYFADYILEARPGCRVTVLDISPGLLERNRPHRRKRLILGDALQLDELPSGETFNIICFNLVLHHLLATDETSTRRLRIDVLRRAATLLRRCGRILIIEPLYLGMFHVDIPSILVYRLTRSQFFAPLCKRLGARTAGEGVLFQPGNRWLHTFEDAGLEIQDQYIFGPWEINPLYKIALNIASIRTGIFWLAPFVRNGEGFH